MITGLVAKPLKLLPKYLVTTAMIKHPKDRMASVPHPPKFINKSLGVPVAGEEDGDQCRYEEE